MSDRCGPDGQCSCHTTRTCMKKVPIFSSLSREEMERIAGIITDKEYRKGEAIYLSGHNEERLYVVNRGRVKIFRLSAAGKEQIIRILYPGDFMGELSLFVHAPLNGYAQALENTAICVIDGNELKKIIKSVPTIAVKIIEELSKRLQNAENLIESLGLHDVERRVADALLRMSGGKDEIILSISKRDLAAHLGMSQETLSRKLSQLQEMGCINQSGQRVIEILDRKNLESIASAGTGPDK